MYSQVTYAYHNKCSRLIFTQSPFIRYFFFVSDFMATVSFRSDIVFVLERKLLLRVRCCACLKKIKSVVVGNTSIAL